MSTARDALDPDNYPSTRAVADQMREHDDREQFLAGIDLVLTGITTLHLPTGQAHTPTRYLSRDAALGSGHQRGLHPGYGPQQSSPGQRSPSIPWRRPRWTESPIRVSPTRLPQPLLVPQLPPA